MGRKKKENAVNTEVKAVKKFDIDDGVVKKSAVIQTARVKIDGYGDGQLTLKGLYYTKGEGQPKIFVLEFFTESMGYTADLRVFDRFMDAWRSYRRFVCLSNEVSKKGGR